VWAIGVAGLIASAGLRIAGETRIFKVGIEVWVLPLLLGVLVLGVVVVLRVAPGQDHFSLYNGGNTPPSLLKEPDQENGPIGR